MKYTIEGFSQKELIRLGLDSVDALILRWFVDFKDSGNMVKKINPADNEAYYWVNYQSLLDDMPILGISNKESLGRRIINIAKKGVLKHWACKEGGSFSMFCINPVGYAALISDHQTQKSDGSGSKVGTPSDQKVGTKDPSTSTNSSSSNHDSQPDKPAETSHHSVVVAKFFEIHQSKYKENPTFGAAEGKQLKSLLNNKEPEKIIQKLEAYYSNTSLWFTKNGGHSFRQFVAHYDEIIPEKRGFDPSKVDSSKPLDRKAMEAVGLVNIKIAGEDKI